MKDNSVKVIYSCKSSIDLIRKRKSKGLFYCTDYEDNKIILIENIKSYKETFFDSFSDMEKYLRKRY